jgi:MFS family permease
MGLDSVGNIAGFFSIAGLIISMPGVWLMRNFGIKFSLIATAVVTIIGSLAGAFATTAEMILASRVLEGAGMGMISVIGPNVMPRLFPLRMQGLVMGIWSQWVCGGIMISTVIGPQLFMSFGWQSLWWLSVGLEVVALIWLLISVKINRVPENELVDGDISKKRTKHNNYVAAGILVGASFIAWCMVYSMVNTFYPTFLQNIKGFDMALSAMPTFVISLLTIPFGITFGVIMDKTNTRKWWLVISYAILAVMMGAVAWVEGGEVTTVWAFAIVMGLLAGGIPTATRAIIPVLVSEPRKMDYTLGIMALTTYLGSLIAGPFGALVANQGWQQAALIILMPIAAIFAIALAIVVKNDKKVFEEAQVAFDDSESLVSTD